MEIDKFQVEVISALRELQEVERRTQVMGDAYGNLYSRLLDVYSSGDEFSDGIGRFLTNWREETTPLAIADSAESEMRQEVKRAEALLQNRSFLSLICPALSSFTGDTFDIAKAITPVLVGATIAGTISVPLVPLLFALLSLALSKVGVAVVCKDVAKAKHS